MFSSRSAVWTALSLLNLSLLNLSLLNFGSMGCSSAVASDGNEPPIYDAGVGEKDVRSDAADAATDVMADTLDGEHDAVADGEQPLSLSLPQAIAGAMFVNPTVYPTVPLHIEVRGEPEWVRIQLGATSYDAADVDGDGTWIAELATEALADGFTTIGVTAGAGEASSAELTADLRVGRQGMQFTQFDVDGSAGTPRLHASGDKRWLSWTDRSGGAPDAWIQQIDGAGRGMGSRLSLVGATSEPALYARTALGFNYVAVLFQSLGAPYKTHFRVVDLSGNVVVPTLALDPPGSDASFGGDLAFDGTAFVMSWRVSEAGGSSKVFWQRVNPVTKEVTGPVVVAASGNDDPIGGFEPFSFVKLALVGPVSLVAFTRKRWIDVLDIDVPKAQVARVQQNGTVVPATYLGGETALTWHREARVQRVGGEFLVLWSSSDLTDPAPNPPNLFYGMRAAADGTLDEGSMSRLFDAVSDRDEPFVVEHGSGEATVGWTDHRSQVENPEDGDIELYVATLSDELKTSEPVVFPHARFVAGLAQLGGTPAGSNALWVWLDERQSASWMDPRPEVWLETAWNWPASQ